MGEGKPLKPASRLTITGSNMYALLIREFALVKDPECMACRVPLPYWGPAPGHLTGYWYMEAPKACAYGCRQSLAMLWARLTTEFKISPPEQVVWKQVPRATMSPGSALPL
jgi:hypothetical protein